MAATKRQYHDSTPNTNRSIFKSGATNDAQLSQSFTITDAYSISSVKILVYRFGLPETITVSITEVSGDNPTGADLAIGTFDADFITEDTDGEWIEITFITPYELSAATKYAIYIRNEGDPTELGPAVYWLGVTGSSSYSDGQGGRSLNGGSSWGNATADFNFETWGSNPPRQINLSYPTNEDTEITLQPLLQWGINGDGAQEGDLLDIYLREDDANFTTDDQLGFDVDATLNSNLQIVAGLEYDATYHWQVQAADSEEDDLLSSAVYSFTVQSFSPPGYSTHPISELPTGENNQITVRRLVVAAKDKIYYEDLS